jgi:L-threonylcarbamoyladenylate synthase
MLLTTDAHEAAAALATGHLAAVPTETVYGLGARADDAQAVARIYAAKGRPADHPLIVHVASGESLAAWGQDIPAYALALTGEFWPGPLTLVVKRSARAKDFITGAQDSVAIRVSSHPLMTAVLTELITITGDPHIGIAAPSANRFGRVSPTTAAHVADELAELMGSGDVILDGGECAVGVESTIVDCTGVTPRLLRPGAITTTDISRVTGLECPVGSQIRSSGSLPSHYSPEATVRIIEALQLSSASAGLDPTAPPTIGLIALSDVPTPTGIVRLAAPDDADEYARALYSALREADALRLCDVLAIAPADIGVGAAIIDRLTRAAHHE